MPLRGFGDVTFKWSLELQQSILSSLESGADLDSLHMYQYTPPNYLTPPYLDATPEITYHKLRPQDRFLILGTDGLWDELGNEEAVRLVGEHLSGIQQKVRECRSRYACVSTDRLTLFSLKPYSHGISEVCVLFYFTDIKTRI